jgi:lipopolysaccharide transport system permease protein
MKDTIAELFRYRELLYMIVYRDIRIKYKQSVMGLLWAVLMPALVVAAGIIVKYGYSVTSGHPLDIRDAASVAVKSVPWAFLVASIRFASTSLIGNPNLVTKIYFPKEIFPFAAVGSQLFDLAIASVVLAVILGFAGVGASWQLLWIPVLLASMTLLAVGIGTIVSAGSLFFRDVKYIVEILLTFGIFFTPVFYDVELFGDRGALLLLNPAAPLLEGFRSVVVMHQAPDAAWLLYSSVIGLLVTIAGYTMFKKLEPSFAESI